MVKCGLDPSRATTPAGVCVYDDAGRVINDDAGLVIKTPCWRAAFIREQVLFFQNPQGDFEVST